MPAKLCEALQSKQGRSLWSTLYLSNRTKQVKSMEWNLETLTEIEPKKFEKEIREINYQILNERLYNFQKLHKQLTEDASLTVEEKLKKRNQLRTVENILRQTAIQKEREHFTQQQLLDEKWKNETLKTNLPNIRFASGSAIEHLLYGRYTLDIIQWETPASTEITINNRKVDLQKVINPQRLKQILEKPFTPAYFILQPSGIFRKDKLQALWYDGKDYERSKHDKYKPRILLAVMKV